LQTPDFSIAFENKQTNDLDEVGKSTYYQGCSETY